MRPEADHSANSMIHYLHSQTCGDGVLLQIIRYLCCAVWRRAVDERARVAAARSVLESRNVAVFDGYLARRRGDYTTLTPLCHFILPPTGPRPHPAPPTRQGVALQASPTMGWGKVTYSTGIYSSCTILQRRGCQGSYSHRLPGVGA